MKIRHRELLDNFARKHADIQKPLQKWINIVEESCWKSHTELKETYPSADYVGNGRYVFNIKGNNYRIVVVIVFVGELLTVRFIGTHSEYDTIDCKTI